MTTTSNSTDSYWEIVDFVAEAVAPPTTMDMDSNSTMNTTDTSGGGDDGGPEEPTVTTWSLIYVTALVSLVQGLAFYAFFLYQRKVEHAKHSVDLYEPRQHTRNHRSPEPFSPTTSWWRAALDIDQEELLRCVGLDSYMFLRFLRLGARLCGLGTCLAVILIPVYATGDNTGNATLQFNQLTLARVETGSHRLWAAVAAWFIFVGFTLHSFWTEWKLYSKNRYAFLARGDIDMEPEYRYAVRVEQIPSKYRTDQALYDYFDRLFPNQVQQATVFVETPELNKLMQERQEHIEQLEKVVAFLHAKPDKPRPQIKVKKEKGYCGGGQQVDAVEHHEAEIKRLNAAVDQERAKFLLALPVVAKQNAATSKNPDTSTAGDADATNGSNLDDNKITDTQDSTKDEIAKKQGSGGGSGVELALSSDYVNATESDEEY